MRWVDGLTTREVAFLQTQEEGGSAQAAWLGIHPDATRQHAKVNASKLNKRLFESMQRWVGDGWADPLPPLDIDRLLFLLDTIARTPDVTNRCLGDAVSLRQKIDPVDVRTYRNFRVDYLHLTQWNVFADEARFRVVVAGRRSGKTHLAITELIVAASKPGAKCYYVAETFDNAKENAWPILQQLLNWEYVAKVNEVKAAVDFTNGSRIRFFGAQKPDHLRGPGLDFLVLDEFASWDRGQRIWDEILRPALSDRLGRALFIGTPAGYNHFRHVYLKGVHPDQPDWAAYQFTTAEAGVVDPSEVDAARADTTNLRSFRQEYEASFEQLANQVYDYFDRLKHVPKVEDIAEAGDKLLVGIDFNLDPMTCVIAQKDENGDAEILEALELNYSNTDELLDEVERRYPERTFTAYPDPTGRKRQTSAGGKTDFSIIEDRPRWKVDMVMYRKPVPLADKINNGQANLRTADGVYHTKIHPVNGAPLIEALEGLTYIEGTPQPDKTGGKDHITDAWAYLMWGAFNRFRKKATIGTFSM